MTSGRSGSRCRKSPTAVRLRQLPARRTVNVYRDGAISLDQTQVTLPELVEKLKAARRQSSDLGVLVRGDADDKYQRIVAVLNACKQAGIQNLGIAVRPMAANEKLR